MLSFFGMENITDNSVMIKAEFTTNQAIVRVITANLKLKVSSTLMTTGAAIETAIAELMQAGQWWPGSPKRSRTWQAGSTSSLWAWSQGWDYGIVATVVIAMLAVEAGASNFSARGKTTNSQQQRKVARMCSTMPCCTVPE